MIKKRIISSFLATMLLVSMTIPSFGNEPMIAKAASVSEGIKESVDVGKKMEVIVKDKNTYTSADGQYVLKYVPYDEKTQDMSQPKSSSIMTQKAVTLNASSAGGSFLNDCSTNFAFLDLNTRTNASDLQTLYLHVLEQLEKCYSADYEYDVQAEDLGDGVPRYILGMASYTGLNISNEELLEVYMRVLVDHPLFFYASNEIVYDGVHLCIQVDEEFVKGSVRDNYISQVASLIKQIASAAGSAKGNYQICKTVHDSILKEAEYAYEADGVTPVDSIYSHNIIGLIKNGKVVCDGYAKTYAAVLNYLDISAIIVNGWGVPQGSVTTDDKAHAWNMVQLGDKEYYFADLTWDDTANSSYAFFCKGISLYDTHSLKPNSNSESYLLLYDELPEVPTQDYSGSNDSLYKEDDPVYKQNNSFTYSYNSTTKTLTFSGNGQITGFENCTKNAWYKYAKKAEKLVIKDGITGVGNFVFMDFTKLKSIDFPNQMSTLGQQAFCRCSSLKQVTLPDGIVLYDGQAFAECSSLHTVVFGAGPENVTLCATNMFDECKKLSTIVVPEDNYALEVIDGVLFNDSGTLLLCYPAAKQATSYTIPSGTTDVGTFAFSCCNNLKSVNMPETLRVVDSSFKGCNAITSLTFPASIQSFGSLNTPINGVGDNLKIIINHSNAKIQLNQTFIGDTLVCWKNKATGKLVNSIAKGTVVVTKYGAKKVPGQRFKVNGVTYIVMTNPKELTLSQMNAQKSVATVNTIGYEPGFKLASKIQYNGWYYTVSKVAVIKPSECSTVKAALYGHDDVKVSWSKAKNAYGYKVYYKKSTSSKYTYAGKTTSHSMKISNLTDGKKYIFKVVPYITLNGKTYTKSPTKTASIYTLKKLSTPRVSKSSSKVKVSWTNISGETGYQISRSTKKTGTNIVATYKTTSGTSKTISATKGKTYYYKVRAYKEVGGQKIYGPWSSVKSYKRK